MVTDTVFRQKVGWGIYNDGDSGEERDALQMRCFMQVYLGSGPQVVSDLVLWKPKYGKRNVGGQAGTFVGLLEADTGVPRDCLPAAMDDRVGWRKRAIVGGGVGWEGAVD